MSEREYVVSLKKDVDYDQFNQDMIATTGSGDIPNRSVDVVNARPGSRRNTHYSLTDAEAELLKSDPRVYGVEIPPDQRDDLIIVRNAAQTGNFTKTTADSGDFINWGLRRCNETTNPYGSEVTVSGPYNYTLDGTGVDVVIQDSGIQADHPDFRNSTGTIRVQEIDWYAESGLPGTMPTDHYTDYDGHGTHCAGIAAGLTYGWAKNARIYAVKVNGLQGSGDPNSGIPISDCFDVIKEWHNNKPVDPNTGFKRPTIVNMSWGYGTYYSTVSEIVYRGVSYTGTAIDSANERWAFGLVPTSGFPVASYITNVRIPSVDTDIQEMIDAGIHICIAAGNRSHKIDTFPGDGDYDNRAITNTGTKYYNRGSSPFDDEAFIVGNIDSDIHTGGLEQKSASSECGPGVNIWAPGTDIMSCTSTINRFTDGEYPSNPDFKICNISGTSMAAPQVCGVGALYLQLNPGVTPAQLRTRITTNTSAKNAIYSTGLDDDHTDTRSIQNSGNNFLYNPFTLSSVFKIIKG